MFKNQYAERKVKKGVIIEGKSKCDKSQQEDSDIYAMFEKYKVAGVVPQTKAGEYLMIDTTIAGKMTLDEAIRQKEYFNEYYMSLPAKVRKVFGDNSEVFYNKYKMGEIDNFVNYGILNEQQIKELKGDNNVKENQNINESTATGGKGIADTSEST